MANFRIVTDSSCDLPLSLAEELELAVLPLTVTLDGKDYQNDLGGQSINIKYFYDTLRTGVMSKTSAPSIDAFLEIIRPILANGEDVLYIGFSSGLSTTYQSGHIACEQLKEEFPERTILTVDSLCASMGQGLLVYHAAEARKAGKTIEETRDWLEENKLHLCHWFTVEDLNHLKRGGRVSPTVAFVGSLLSIKPVMHVDDAGTLQPVSKTRGRKASIQALVQQMKEHAIDPKNQVVFISHGDCEEDVAYMSELILRDVGAKKIVYNYVGPVIGSHSGAGTLALFFLGDVR